MTKLITMALAATCTLAIATGASAATYIVGAAATSNNGAPFVFDSGPRYQQVYSANQFTGPLSISGITFYGSKDYPLYRLAEGMFQISLSTTDKTVHNLNGNYVDNIGADQTEVFSGTMPVLQDPMAQQNTKSYASFTLPFTTTFNYDPLKGNLLLDVTSKTGFGGIGSLQAYNVFTDSASEVTARVFRGNLQYGFGLTTGFVEAMPAGVPEPATWAMMIIGFGLTGAMMRGQRGKAVFT
jgi:hypothetical protein